MKAYKSFKAAVENNRHGNPIIRIGGTRGKKNLYIVEESHPMSRFAEIALINPDTGTIEAHASVSKFAALGNANWATPQEGQRPHALRFD